MIIWNYPWRVRERQAFWPHNNLPKGKVLKFDRWGKKNSDPIGIDDLFIMSFHGLDKNLNARPFHQSIDWSSGKSLLIPAK